MVHDIVSRLRGSSLHGLALRQCAMLELSYLENYDWCGIYLVQGHMLELEAFEGNPTEHTRIPIGVGVCGTAVAENRNQVIADVREVDNYLACSLATRAEIVVLIRKDGEVIGQIDVDSHTVAAFTKDDESHLIELADLLAERW